MRKKRRPRGAPRWLGRGEVYLRRAVFRVPVAQLLDPATRYTSTIRRGAVSFKGPAFDVDGTIVWGFTAMVLDRLFDACGWTVPWDVSDERPVAL